MKNNILITGSHRSGSTWVGKIIEQANNIRYVHEPFNISLKHKSIPFSYWFEHISDSASTKKKKDVKNYLNSFYLVIHRNNFKWLLEVRSIKALYRFLVDLKNRLTKRTLYKDPIALMSAEWLYKNMDWDIVIVIRHPAAFIASLKVKNWQFDFNNFLQQRNLLDTYLKDYADTIADYATNKRNIVEQGILLWNVIHSTIHYYQQKYGNKWYFIKHEDVSLNPVQEFEKLYHFLHLDYTNDVKKYIINSTTAQNDSSLKRDSKENIKSWKKRLSAEEICLIQNETKQVWTHFYKETDW